MCQLVAGFHDMMQVLVIHRDLKLQNIMVHFPDETFKLMNMTKEEKKKFFKNVNMATTHFEIKIADFGFSKKLKDRKQKNKTICGTPLYMAPQVVKKTSYSYKADIWSLGVILFEMLNGSTPFHSKNRAEFESKVEASNYSLKESVMDKLTIECLLFLSHCLQENEDERKCITELIHHPYITMTLMEQTRLSVKATNRIFAQEGGTPKLIFSAKDKDQKKRIEAVLRDTNGKYKDVPLGASVKMMTEKTQASTVMMTSAASTQSSQFTRLVSQTPGQDIEEEIVKDFEDTRIAVELQEQKSKPNAPIEIQKGQTEKLNLKGEYEACTAADDMIFPERPYTVKDPEIPPVQPSTASKMIEAQDQHGPSGGQKDAASMLAEVMRGGL